jgi:hypothetical protein
VNTQAAFSDVVFSPSLMPLLLLPIASYLSVTDLLSKTTDLTLLIPGFW